MSEPTSERLAGSLTLRRIVAAGARAAQLLAGLSLVLSSLLAFPSVIPAMIAAWLFWYSYRIMHGRSAWQPLVVCLGVLVIKRVGWPPGIVAVVAAMVLAIGAEYWRRPTIANVPRRMNAALLAIIWLAWAAAAWDWHRSVHANHLVSPVDARPVVCIGDSLTSYPPRRGYPKDLARLLSVPVENLGQPGVTSGEALKQLPALLAARPQAVVIELGGHDYLKDGSWLPTKSRAEVKGNLIRLIVAARECGAEVVLMEIPRGFIVDPFAGLERELAREYDLELISDSAIRQLVLWSPDCPPGLWTGGPYLSDDGLHPNARGDAYLAAVVAQTLARLYGPQILKSRQ